MRKFNIGIIGYGGMASYHHKKIGKPENVVFVSAFDISKKRLEKAQSEGLFVYDSFDEFIKNDNLDAVLIATPNNSHKDYAVRAMNEGKHVICEKPVSLNSSELEEMIAVSKANGVIFTVHQNRRMDKDYRIIRKILKDDTLGEIFRIESRVQGSRGIADTWRRKKECGGGMMYDWGVHLIDQILMATESKVTSVFAEFQYISQSEVDDNFRLTMTFENGLSALVEIGTCNFIMHPIWYVAGKEGTAQIDYWNLEGRIFKLINKDIKWEDEIPSSLVGPSITLAPRAEDTMKCLPLPEPDIVPEDDYFYKNFAEAILRKTELLIKPEETMRTMKIIDLAFESGRENKVINCNI